MEFLVEVTTVAGYLVEASDRAAAEEAAVALARIGSRPNYEISPVGEATIIHA